MVDAHSLPVDKSVEELAERIFCDRYPGLSVHRRDIGNKHRVRRRYFVLLIILCLFYSTFHMLKNRFKVGVDDERCAVRVTDLFEFTVSLLTLCSGKHVYN